MDDWKHLFRPHILERGLDYFEMGAVDEVERTETGYRAAVEGTEEYEVEIELRDVIDGIPEAELRNLLEHMALENESLKNQILTRYSRTITGRQMAMLKKEIDGIAGRYSGRSGFVDWRSAGGYISEMESFLCNKVQAVIDKGCYMQAFELTNHVFVTVGNQDMDDSDGGTSMAADTCYECWQQILEKCGEQDRAMMHAWFEKHQSDGIVIDYMEDYIRDFLLNEFHDRKLIIAEMQMLDERIEKRGDNTDCGTCYSAHNGRENNILKRIQLMKALGATEEEILEYRKKNRRFAAVRMLEIEEFIQAGKDMDAVRALRESKELDRKSKDWVKGYSEKLIELYGRMHMDREYKDELLFHVFTCQQNSLDFVKKLKAVCNPMEWEQNREKLLAAPAGQGIRLSLLESEKLYDRLLEAVVNTDFVYQMDQYEKTLKKIYPDRMRDAYIAYIKAQAETAGARRDYKELMAYLKKIASYPQGREAAEQIAREWRTLYKRRSAMMDELGRAGF